MTAWVVVLIEADTFFDGSGNIRTFGPYGTAEEAEKARQRIHSGAERFIGSHQQYAHRKPRTYTRQLEVER